MITEEDIRALKVHETRTGIIAHWALVIVPLFFLVTGVLNLWLALKTGGCAGLDLIHLFQNWGKGIEVGIQYPEPYLRAMQRLTTALLLIGGAIPLFILAYGNNKRRKLDARILATLKEAGIIKESVCLPDKKDKRIRLRSGPAGPAASRGWTEPLRGKAFGIWFGRVI